MKTNLKFASMVGIACIFFVSCVSNPSSPASPATSSLILNAPGVFILNQGQPSPTTLDYYDIATNVYHSNIIGQTAGLAAYGNDLQFGNGDTLFLLVENSNSLYAIADTTGSILTNYTSPSFSTPFKMAVLNDSIVAVAEYGNGVNKITIYNIHLQEAIIDIPVGDNPQAIVYENGIIFAACPGGTGTENRIDAINYVSGTDNHFTADLNPTALAVYGDSIVLALCTGSYTAIHQVRPSTM